ncbi:CPBP family intramembrane glutamic endopeptidase [Sphingomicrobium astaxanthinifaciens]|uniref:CPBP family intramembrane glutamic endopeptidase n=1 Tax=Sphingomicrobium astaxanthinifaciens TaxID=1227949 RepID=UPI001FCA93DB|nr:CPBP family intramembrane glutamic endopeptidase [Sphingomicrobium astaxanthinifaciens]MCJ7420733.1 CPBP family intramembrane metalloprotease [Sphingomicrobium astaxanthinifaciens]
MPDLSSWLAPPLLLIVALVALGPLRDRVHRRRLAARGAAYRDFIYREFLAYMWPVAGIVVACWVAAGQRLETLGFAHEPSTGLAIAWGVTALLALYSTWSTVQVRRHDKARESLERQIDAGGNIDFVRPESPGQLKGFLALSVTAGVTEEIVFRGFLIMTLALVMPLWAAALLSLTLFVLAHSYQGWRGMLTILPISTVLTVLFVISGSLWPVIVLHIVVDVTGGLMIYEVVKSKARAAA